MNWYIAVLKKYAVFDGRAHRTEFWMFALFNIAIAVGLAVIGAILKLGILSTLYSFGVLLPGIGVTVRRLHDTGRPWWWILAGFIPIAGIFVMIYLLAQEGQPGANAYGPDPKESPVLV